MKKNAYLLIFDSFFVIIVKFQDDIYCKYMIIIHNGLFVID